MLYEVGFVADHLGQVPGANFNEVCSAVPQLTRPANSFLIVPGCCLKQEYPDSHFLKAS